MISLHSGLRRSVALASIPVLATLATANASTTVTTDPVGVVTKTVPDGSVVFSVPFLQSSVFQGVVASEEGDSLVFGTSDVPNISSAPHYVHVLSGAFIGETITILSATSNSVLLEHATPDSLIGESVCIRPHHTIGMLFPESALEGSETLTLYNDQGGSDAYLYNMLMGWVDSGFNDASNVIIYPGEGFAFRSSGSRTFSYSGQVLTTPLAIPVFPSATMVRGTMNPAASVSFSTMDLAQTLPDFATITIYSNQGEGLSASFIGSNLPGFGIVDGGFNDQNNHPVDPFEAMVIRSSRMDIVVVPPAYDPN